VAGTRTPLLLVAPVPVLARATATIELHRHFSAALCVPAESQLKAGRVDPQE
jgi:hypothetical protein